MKRPGAKGTRNERRCENDLIAAGYVTWRVTRHRFQNMDMFGIFDVVAVAGDGSHLVFIQVKSNRCDRKTKTRMELLLLPPGCIKQVWIWIDQHGWKKETIK